MVQIILSNFYLLQCFIVLRTAHFREKKQRFLHVCGSLTLAKYISLRVSMAGACCGFSITFAEEDSALGDGQMSSRQDWNMNAFLQLS